MEQRVAHTVRATGFVLAALVCLPVEARQAPAGARPERPYRGVFGQDTGTWSQELTASLSLGGGWDSDVLAGARGDNTSSDPVGQEAGPFTSGSAGLSYSLRQGRFDLGASAGSSIRFYGNNLSRPFVGSHGGGATAGYRFTDRTTLSAQQSVAFQPFDSRLLYAPIDDGIVESEPPSFDASASADNYVSLSSAASLSHDLSARSSLQIGYTYYATEYSLTEERRHGGRARFTHEIAEGLALRLGYGYEVRKRQDPSGQPDPADLERHHIDTGLDFNRALSVSRRTTLSFGAGATAVNDLETNRIYAVGHVALNHEIGRSWDASLGYGRNVQFADYLDRPVLSDGVQASLGGLINRRVSFRSNAGASYGSVGFSEDEDNRTIAYRASAGVMFALNRYMGFGVTYSYYQHDYGQDVVLPDGLSRAVRRHVVQANISVWAPLYRRAGRLDAAR